MDTTKFDATDWLIWQAARRDSQEAEAKLAQRRQEKATLRWERGEPIVDGLQAESPQGVAA